jgi:hypothetical protein
MFRVVFGLGTWWTPNVGIKKPRLLNLRHGKDAKVGYQKMVDPKVTRTRQIVINALGSPPRESQGGLFIGVVRGSGINVRTAPLTALFTLSVQTSGYYSHFTPLSTLHRTNCKVTCVLYCWGST